MEKYYPVVFKQGTNKCLLLKPSKDIIVALLYNEERATIDSYQYGNQLSNKVSLFMENY